jgi:hypothetical protein
MAKIGLFEPETDVQLMLGEDWIIPTLADPPDEFWDSLPNEDELSYLGSSGLKMHDVPEVPQVLVPPEDVPVVYGISSGWAYYAICLRAVAKAVGGDGTPTESGGVFFWRFDTGMPNSV